MDLVQGEQQAYKCVCLLVSSSERYSQDMTDIGYASAAYLLACLPVIGSHETSLHLHTSR